MSAQFETHYLVCIDQGDDINYVLHRTTDITEAREEVKIYQKSNPGQTIYLTMEKVASKKSIAAKNPTKCGCGYGVGQCIGFLSCKCEQLSMCKKVDRNNPLGQIDIDLEFTYRNPFGPQQRSTEEVTEDDEDEEIEEGEDDQDEEEWKQWAAEKEPTNFTLVEGGGSESVEEVDEDTTEEEIQ